MTVVSHLEHRANSTVFAHDWRDAWLVTLGLFELGGKVAIVMFWAVLPVPITLLSMVGLCLLNCTNYICVAHYFLHTPFFSRPWLNHVWGVVGSLSLGMPITLYRAHHLNHHRFGWTTWTVNLKIRVIGPQSTAMGQHRTSRKLFGAIPCWHQSGNRLGHSSQMSAAAAKAVSWWRRRPAFWPPPSH